MRTPGHYYGEYERRMDDLSWEWYVLMLTTPGLRSGWKLGAAGWGETLSGMPVDRADLLKDVAIEVSFDLMMIALSGGPRERGPRLLNPRHAEYGKDLGAITRTMERLGERAVKYSGGDWRKAESLYSVYSEAVQNRLWRTGSRFGIELQPAALVGGQRVPNFIWLLKELRTEAKLTQKQLAQLVGVTERTIIFWEMGSVLPSFEALQRLYEILGPNVQGAFQLSTPNKTVV
jgi:DNA-binding XRE family transcriptional regulator